MLGACYSESFQECVYRLLFVPIGRDILCSDGEKVLYGMLVWSTGVGPSPLTKGLSCDKSKEGRIACDGWQRYLPFPFRLSFACLDHNKGLLHGDRYPKR